jgi:glycosyltransferase involved in cell wall biosynthesis
VRPSATLVPDVPVRRNEHAIILLATTVPPYRRRVIDALAQHFPDRFAVLAGEEFFDPTIRLDASHDRLHVIKNLFFFNRRLLWQRGVLKVSVSAPITIMELNPRVVSTWLILLARRALGRRSILWGHSWPRAGARSRSDVIRHCMRRLATALVVYSNTEAEELRAKMPTTTVVAAPNALYPRALSGAAMSRTDPTDFLFVGRLVPAKRADLLLEAFGVALDRLPSDTNLVFVGDGPLRSSLVQRGEVIASGRVRFTGEINEFESLRAIYATTAASVRPGDVGLSLTQSLWFGVPALIAWRETHSPEFEAAEAGRNSLFYASDSVTALAECLVAFAADRATWLSRREEIARACAETYSIEAMVEPIASLVRTLSR